MAWVSIPNNSLWEYQNSPADPGAGSPLRTLWLEQSNGIRTKLGHSVYTQTRKVGDSNTANRGELSKSFWDAQS